jgi:hypothetical protein
MGWARHVKRIGMTKRAYKIFVRKKLKERFRLDLGSIGGIILKLHMAIESADGSE